MCVCVNDYKGFEDFSMGRISILVVIRTGIYIGSTGEALGLPFGWSEQLDQGSLWMINGVTFHYIASKMVV